MGTEEPTFTYDASKPLTEEQKRALEEAKRNPPPLQFVDDARDALRVQRILDGTSPIHSREDLHRALVSEARAHQWEHRQPIGATLGSEVARRIAIGESIVGLASPSPDRTFTRAEVLTVLKADMAARASDIRPDEQSLLRHLIRVFERME